MIFNEAINNRPRFMIVRCLIHFQSFHFRNSTFISDQWRCTVPTHIVMLIVDGMVAYSGYLLYGAHVKSNVLVGNFPANSIAVALARLGISVTVTASIPLQLFPGRVCVLNLIDAARRYYAKIESPAIVATASDANSANRGPLYWGVTAVCVVLVCLLSYLVNSLGIVYEVVGATAATLMSYILPGLCTCF
jgi:amino acid permease